MTKEELVKLREKAENSAFFVVNREELIKIIDEVLSSRVPE